MLLPHATKRGRWEAGIVKCGSPRLLHPTSPGAPATAFQHFGPVIVCCDGADLRLTPTGVEVHDASGMHLETVPVPSVPRSEVIDELWSVAREGRAPLHGGAWSRATMEVCLAILASERERAAIMLRQQVDLPS